MFNEKNENNTQASSSKNPVIKYFKNFHILWNSVTKYRKLKIKQTFWNIFLVLKFQDEWIDMVFALCFVRILGFRIEIGG